MRTEIYIHITNSIFMLVVYGLFNDAGSTKVLVLYLMIDK